MKNNILLITLVTITISFSAQNAAKTSIQIESENKLESDHIPHSVPINQVEPKVSVNKTSTVTTTVKTNDTNFSGNFLGRTYQIIFEELTWNEANDKAIAMGGTLACLNSEAKLNYIQSLRTMHNNISPVWIGLTDSANEGHWKWVCGDDLLQKMSYYLERGRQLDYRDYGHLMQKKGFLSRTNEGDKPNFIRGYHSVPGYVVEFKTKKTDIFASNPIDEKYQKLNSKLFSQVIKARSLVTNYRGDKKQLETAKKILEDVIKQNDLFSPALRELARVYIKDSMINSNYHIRSQLSLAENFLYKAIKLDPAYAAAYIDLASALIKSMRYDEAESALLNAMKIGANQIKLQIEWGYLKQKQRKYKIAAIHYNVVLSSTDKKSIEYRAALGYMASVYTVQKRYTEATSSHEELIKLHPNDAWLWGNYANFLFYTKHIDDSIIKSRAALALKDYPFARSTLSNALYTKWAELKDNLNTQAEAETYFAEAYALQPNAKLAISQLIRSKHTKKAAAALQAWLIKNSDKEETSQNI